MKNKVADPNQLRNFGNRFGQHLIDSGLQSRKTVNLDPKLDGYIR